MDNPNLYFYVNRIIYIHRTYSPILKPEETGFVVLRCYSF